MSVWLALCGRVERVCGCRFGGCGGHGVEKVVYTIRVCPLDC